VDKNNWPENWPFPPYPLGAKMTWRKRTIMEMAREAQLPYFYQTGETANLKQLEAFAALVREDERDRVLKILDDQGTWAHTGDLIELVKEST